MTGFEPATFTLAISFGQRYSPAITQIDAARLPFLMVHDCPQVTIIAIGAWYFRGADVTEFRTTGTTFDGDIWDQISWRQLRQCPFRAHHSPSRVA
jgi:hypothetical protein